MKVVGLDLSLTSTGVADWTGTYTLRPPKGADRGMPRLDWIQRRIHAITKAADLVVVEGYSYGSKGRAVVSMGELGGVVRLRLWQAERPYAEISPATVKKLATGNGNSPKAAVLAAAIHRLGYEGHSSDEADAAWLQAAALIHYQLEGAPKLPKTHLAALAKVQWPNPQVSGAGLCE